MAKTGDPILTADVEKQLVQEMKEMEYEPLLPVEKKLIAMSIALGVVLLFIFVWISYTFFPGNR